MKEVKGTKFSEYKLPVHKQEDMREGFGGVEKKQWYNLAELQYGDYAGTTETDSVTHKDGNKGNTCYNDLKSQQKLDAPGKKLGFNVKLDKNTKKG